MAGTVGRGLLLGPGQGLPGGADRARAEAKGRGVADATNGAEPPEAIGSRVARSSATDPPGPVLALALLLVAPGLGAADDFLWIEGEAAAASSVNRHSWYRSVKPGLLSGGDWLAHFGAREGTAEYRVEVPAAGRRVLWVRANPVQSALSVRVGDGPWKTIDVSKA